MSGQKTSTRRGALGRPLELHPDRLFPAEPGVRDVARELYATVRDLPIISPHGHTDPGWFALNEPFGNATELLLTPDHYLFRMLYSQGVRLEDLGVGNPDADPRNAWRLFSERYHLFRGTPSRMWLDLPKCSVSNRAWKLRRRTSTSTR
jgi:glucuronate isomerase